MCEEVASNGGVMRVEGGGPEGEPGWREVCLLWWRGVVGDGAEEAQEFILLVFSRA